MTIQVLTIVLLSMISPPDTQARDSRPWEMALEQRVAERFSPAARQERLRRHHPGGATEVFDTISGATEPHLFLPVDLFESFVQKGFAEADSRVFRTIISGQSDDLFAVPDDWDAVSADVHPLASFLAAEKDLLRRLGAARSVSERRELQAELSACNARRDRELVQAFRNVQARFGRPRLLRFLYTTIAPARTEYVRSLSDERIRMLIEREKEAAQ
jgi:hypothetical protein